MNMNSQTTIITTDEYFQLLSKENLSDIEKIQKAKYERYIKLSQQYEDLLSPAAQDILNKYNSKTRELVLKENRSIQEENKIKEFQSILEAKQDSLKLVHNKKINSSMKNFANAGYIDATIVLAIILNIGFIVAMTFLGK